MAAVRADAINAFKDFDGESADANDDFELSARPKTDEEVEREVREYREFLLEMGGGEEEVRRTLGLTSEQVDVFHYDDEYDGDGDEDDSETDVGDVSGELDSPQMASGSKSEAKEKGASRGRSGKTRADEDFLME